MSTRSSPSPMFLEDGAAVVVIGGGPAGAFFAIRLLRRARELKRAINVTIIDRRVSGGCTEHCGMVQGKKGCGQCAGGLSARLLASLEELQLRLPPEVIQSRVRSVTVQGYWKNIELEVPEGRNIFSVFRISRAGLNNTRQHSFDAVLLDHALKLGARLVSGEVSDTARTGEGKPVVTYMDAGGQRRLEADFVVFAAGVNAAGTSGGGKPGPVELFQRLNPAYIPPRLRRSLVFELEAPHGLPAGLEEELHFIEYGSDTLRLEMCSLLPKTSYITVVLVGQSVDESKTTVENWRIIKQFLELPHIGKLLPPRTSLRVTCICNPWLTVGTARNAFADRVAAVGDMVTARLYKDGIFSAHQTSQTLAEALLTWGTDRRSLEEAYAPILRKFRRDNRYAAMVFLAHRIIFSSSILSRILYQAVITERKSKPANQRPLASLLWKTASGDEDYEVIFRLLIQPAAIWTVVAGGGLITLRNFLTEILFGLKWEGFGRFTTGVAKERFEMKRRAFARNICGAEKKASEGFEFERMYTIRVRASADSVRQQLEQFGEPERGYLRPRLVHIERIAGRPNEPGCVIRYRVLGGLLSFCLELERIQDGRLIIYRVQNGFARGGVLLFEIDPAASQSTNLSIYLAFDFERGRTRRARCYWGAFRFIFPEFVHDVIWNHALCQLKNLAEAGEAGAHPALIKAEPALACQ